jgi:hypothetical protein
MAGGAEVQIRRRILDESKKQAVRERLKKLSSQQGRTYRPLQRYGVDARFALQAQSCRKQRSWQLAAG